MHLKVSLNKTQNFTKQEYSRLMECLPLLEKAVNSGEFKKRILAIKKFTDCEMSSLEVYETFMKGRQYNETTDDCEMDIDLTIYYKRFSSAVGFTYPNTVRTYINRKFFWAFTLAGICGNIGHEYSHKLGFDHSYYWTTVRDMSVPYFIGNLIEELVNKLLKGEELE
jgi:hypothetical protein